MLVSISLSKKVIALMAAPLILELIFVGLLGVLHQKAEEEAERAQHSTRITEAINVLGREIYSFLAILNTKSFTPALFETDYCSRFRNTLKDQFQILTSETKDKPSELQIVLNAEVAAKRGLSILARLETDPVARASLDDNAECGRIIHDLKTKGSFILSRDFVDLNSREKAIVKRSPRKQAVIRHQQLTVLWVAVILNILSFMAAAVYLVRSITLRLQIMSDNAFRFARGRELNAVLSGKDEIAILDQSFHNMAQSVNQAARKERAVVEQARDVICSISACGKFLAINPAAEKMLGYKQSELIGQDYTKYVAADDVEYLAEAVDRAREEGDIEPLEVRLCSKSGAKLDTLWSMHWSGLENSLFCVIHDDSARKQAERLRQDLIAMVTHDMKTPLSFIGNFMELLEENVVGNLDSRGLEMVDMANNCVNQMSKMVNDMLDMEKVKAGMITVNLSVVSTGSLIESACGPLKTLAAAAGVNLDWQKIDDNVNVDAEMIIRVIGNLVANAIKFSPAQTTITVRAARENDLITISVSDQGCGIPEKLIAVVFDKYVQVPGKKMGGSGLGLAICKAFVEANGGRIFMQSHENQGTTVSFELPACPAA